MTPESAWEQAHAAWPQLKHDRREFLRELRELPSLDGVHVADLYLARACAAGGATALRAFEQLLRPLVSDAVGRTLKKEPAFVEDVLQAVRERLLVPDPAGKVRVRDYAGAGPLAAWLRQASVRVALNMAKTTRRDAALDEVVGQRLAGAGDDPELEALKQRCRKELKGAIQAALKALEPVERELLKLNLMDGESIDKLAERLKVSRATAARRLVAVRARLLELTRAELKRRLNWSERELKSVVGLVRSQLDLSLSQHLR
jgi:RNA polymerase sigma-70 factor (ECF subfamily)